MEEKAPNNLKQTWETCDVSPLWAANVAMQEHKMMSEEYRELWEQRGETV